MINCDDIRPGDFITGVVCSSEQHGPVFSIRGTPGELRTLVYQDGTEVTLMPGATWPAGQVIRNP